MICELEGCSTEFTPKNTLQRFCNPKHRQKAADKRYDERGELRSCAREECDVEFKSKDHRKKYCSHSCSAQVTNRSLSRKKWVAKQCGSCPEEFLGPASQKYCSRECGFSARAAVIEERISEWISGGESWSYKGHAIPDPVRKYLLEEAGNKCTRCGWCEPNPKLGKPILCIDHVNGNWKDNRRDNLVVLCYNCHTLTPTFNALNIGSESGRRPGEGKRRPH